jgi:transposase
MMRYVRFDRDQPFLLPPDLKDWLPEDELAHVIAAAVDRVRLGAFRTNPQAGGRPPSHPRLIPALLVWCYADGVFSSRRFERAADQDIGARFTAAHTHPGHDTIARFRRTNKAGFEAAFLEVRLLARERGVLRLARCRLPAPGSTPTPRRSARCAEPVLGPAAGRTRGTGHRRGARSWPLTSPH